MSIDWFTFAAQVVNFLVLVWLLKRFLYGPIVRAMKERQERIAARLAEADEKQQAAEREEAAYREKTEEFERQRNELLEQAHSQAEQRRKQWLKEAREEVESRRREWEEDLKREQKNRLNDIRAHILDQVVGIARRALQELADRDLNTQMLAVFQQRLTRLEDERRRKIVDAIGSDGSAVVVRTAYEVPSEARTELRDLLRQQFGRDVEVAFVSSRDVICGVELQAAGQKLSWSVGDYLASLEDDLTKLIAR